MVTELERIEGPNSLLALQPLAAVLDLPAVIGTADPAASEFISSTGSLMASPGPVDWDLIRDVIPPPAPKHGCEPTDLREVVNTLLYQNKTGCQWDMPPHDLTPKSTAFDYYSRWREDGTWDRLLDALRRRVRAEAGRGEGRRPRPSIASRCRPPLPVGGSGATTGARR